MKGNSFLSTKSGEFHGIGIQNIKKVVESYNGFVKMGNDEKIFTLMAAFPNSYNTTEEKQRS